MSPKPPPTGNHHTQPVPTQPGHASVTLNHKGPVKNLGGPSIRSTGLSTSRPRRFLMRAQAEDLRLYPGCLGTQQAVMVGKNRNIRLDKTLVGAESISVYRMTHTPNAFLRFFGFKPITVLFDANGNRIDPSHK